MGLRVPDAEPRQSGPAKPKPLRVDSVAIVATGGWIGMTICPGHSGRRDLPNRDMNEDLAAIRSWRPDAIVTLMEDHEFKLIAVEALPGAMMALGIEWYHLPIVDTGIPEDGFHASWVTSGAELRGVLTRGGRVLLHCRGGLGRSGTIAAQLLIELGMSADAAIREVRAARPGAIENETQEDYVLGLKTTDHRSRGVEDG